VADTARGSAATQRCVERLDKWADKKLMKFSKGKCQILHLGRNKSMPWVRLVTSHKESCLAEMDMGSW